MEWRERSDSRSSKLDTDITYAELNFLRASRLNAANMEPPAVPSKPTLVCRTFTPTGFRAHLTRWLLIGSLILVLLLLILSITLLCLYLQANARLGHETVDIDALLSNNTHWQLELARERAEWEEAERNRSSLEKECQGLQEQTLPALLAEQRTFQESLEAERERRRHVTQLHEALREECGNLRENSLFLAKNSTLYRRCNASMDPVDPTGKCVFCPEGWLVFGSRCYLYFTVEKNWESSERSCRALNAHLAVVHNREEQKFLTDLITTVTWIGLSDRDMENDWRWTDGTPYTSTPKFWPRNQPDNVGNEDCVTLSRDSAWNDDKCWWLHHSVCEKSASVLYIQSGFINL